MASTIGTMSARHVEQAGGLKKKVTWGLILGLLVGAVWFLFLRGEEPPHNSNLPAPGEISNSASAPESSAAKTGKLGKAPLETFKVYAPKDPFEPLVEAKSAPAADGVRSGSPRSDSNAAQASVAGGHSVQLLEIVDSTRVEIVVDGTQYSVDLGESFAESFKLVTIGPSCVSLLYGDEQFTLC